MSGPVSVRACEKADTLLLPVPDYLEPGARGA